MASEVRKFLQEQLNQLPENHPDRTFLDALQGMTQAYLYRTEAQAENPRKEKPEFRRRPFSATDRYLTEIKAIGKFDEKASAVLYSAEDEARRLNHNYIGTEHILISLAQDEYSVKILDNLGINASKVKAATEFIIARGDRAVEGRITFTPRSRAVINLAMGEAQNVNKSQVDSGDLLLGLVREGESIASGVLESLGADATRVRRVTTS